VAALPTALAALLVPLALAGPGLASRPPLVDATAAIPDAILDLRYATARNPAGRPLYAAARCLLLAPVADRLGRAAADLRASGHRLVLWDCYRPLAAQRELWRLRPDPRWVADPARGSRHSRGAAVDVALADSSGHLLELPTDHDAFVPAARPDAVRGVSPAAAAHRSLLRQAMERAGFRQNRGEWWHYDAPEGAGAPLLDVPLETIPAALR
jgi:D-alanyl-D-alanine dipeptidase